ncbi:hypothetical protein PTSG_07024 [Salpingoeca rosetta]|uniref:Uncharacterized protein n=1 Tax=Salpingoeca rosetta (strain ATCC 50818 / BSB-021) TaxID=946362 RepID=F2UDU1_SALR5|nr:uncharacterized protein PTSG_07024 [Salpingoeca rosetta]EGD74791.1 hypothetical protein PTSG_07024 [Salpingoeca rosetta]|eukprot:XP_004992436.1 hypothetical protein PTSG_07024 [Salpingoeca rosetta]
MASPWRTGAPLQQPPPPQQPQQQQQQLQQPAQHAQQHFQPPPPHAQTAQLLGSGPLSFPHGTSPYSTSPPRRDRLPQGHHQHHHPPPHPNKPQPPHLQQRYTPAPTGMSPPMGQGGGVSPQLQSLYAGHPTRAASASAHVYGGSPSSPSLNQMGLSPGAWTSAYSPPTSHMHSRGRSGAASHIPSSHVGGVYAPVQPIPNATLPPPPPPATTAAAATTQAQAQAQAQQKKAAVQPKSKAVASSTKAAAKKAPPKPRGRPKGSGRKKAPASKSSTTTAAATGRGRGRGRKATATASAKGGSATAKQTAARKRAASTKTTPASTPAHAASPGDMLQHRGVRATTSISGDSVFSPPLTPQTPATSMSTGRHTPTNSAGGAGSDHPPSKRAKGASSLSASCVYASSPVFGVTSPESYASTPHVASPPTTTTTAGSTGNAASRRSTSTAGGSKAGGASASSASSAVAAVADHYLYQEEVAQLMFQHGEVERLSDDARALIEDIARQHVILLAQECNAAAEVRGADQLDWSDIAFALRKDGVRLARLTQFVRLRGMSSKDVRASKPAVQRAWQFGTWDLLNSLNDMTAEKPLHYSKGVADDIRASSTSQCHLALEMSDKAHKLSRRASFTYKKAKKFRKWIQFHHFVQRRPSDDMIELFGFIASETVAELAQTVRRMIRDSAKRRKSKRMVVSAEIVSEAFRRLQRDASIGSLLTRPHQFSRPHMLFTS